MRRVGQQRVQRGASVDVFESELELFRFPFWNHLPSCPKISEPYTIAEPFIT